MNFKNKFSFDKRHKEANRIILKYPDRIPIIVEKKNNSKMSDIDKNKYLVPGDLTMGQFIYVIRKRLKLKSHEAIFLFINRKLINNTQFVKDVYYANLDEDNFMYVTYCCENTFGDFL
jgi:GABA(A) receptor-associated protein